MVGMKQDRSGPFLVLVVVQLKEVAKVQDGFIESQWVFEADAEFSVWMMVRKQSGSNSVKGADAVMAELFKIARAAAADIEFKVIFNQADFINQALGNLSSTAMIPSGVNSAGVFTCRADHLWVGLDLERASRRRLAVDGD